MQSVHFSPAIKTNKLKFITIELKPVYTGRHLIAMIENISEDDNKMLCDLMTGIILFLNYPDFFDKVDCKGIIFPGTELKNTSTRLFPVLYKWHGMLTLSHVSYVSNVKDYLTPFKVHSRNYYVLFRCFWLIFVFCYRFCCKNNK